MQKYLFNLAPEM